MRLPGVSAELLNWSLVVQLIEVAEKWYLLSFCQFQAYTLNRARRGLQNGNFDTG